MQKINNSEKGITLIALVITIIVLFIILGISLNYGLDNIRTVSNKKFETELSIVQEAIMQRYTLLKVSNELGIIAPAITDNASINTESEINRPEEMVGTRIADLSYIKDNGFQNISFRSNYELNSSGLKFEEYYYLLDGTDLEKLGIEKGEEDSLSNNESNERKYVVNYKTGEVFDIKNKQYFDTAIKDSDPIYLQQNSVKINDRVYNFNDD